MQAVWLNLLKLLVLYKRPKRLKQERGFQTWVIIWADDNVDDNGDDENTGDDESD